MRVKALCTVTFGALYVLMGLGDQISSDRSQGYEGDGKSIDPHTSQCSMASVSAERYYIQISYLMRVDCAF